MAGVTLSGWSMIGQIVGGPLDAVAQLGLAAGLVVWFAWRDKNREKRMADTIDRMTSWQSGELQKLIEKNIDTMQETVMAMREVRDALAWCKQRAGRGDG